MSGDSNFPSRSPTIIDSSSFSDLTWIDKGHLNQPRAYHAVVTVGEKIYAIGGIYDGQWLASVEAYDPLSDSWVYVQPMPTARCSLAACVVNGKIYVIGGAANYQTLDTVEIYDLELDLWSAGAPKPTGVSGLAVTVVQGKVCALCGTLGWLDYRDNVEIYDPMADS